MAKFEFNLNVSQSDIDEMNEICGYYNITFEEFLNILVHRSLLCGELPFYPTYDSKNVRETLDALADTDNHKTFANFDEMMEYVEHVDE